MFDAGNAEFMHFTVLTDGSLGEMAFFYKQDPAGQPDKGKSDKHR